MTLPGLNSNNLAHTAITCLNDAYHGLHWPNLT